ncbi:MAG: hypothetical protein ACTJG4_16190 [Vreelandella alkaliphila]|uniref:hypothetical protein n=1 Tax=Vreelandella alkaliphila TaxID=272774 RepID=UPI003F95AFF8
MFEVESILQIAPSYGFFGNTNDTSLSIQVGRTVKRILISNDLTTATFINIADVKVLSPDFKSIEDVGCEVNFSSIKGEGEPAALLKGGGFHSKREINPWIELVFDYPVRIDSLVVYNRGDYHGRRSQFINVTIIDECSEEVNLYSVQSPESIGVFYYLMEREFGKNIIKRYLNRPSKEVFRSKVLLPLIVSKINRQEIDKKSGLFFLQFLSIWSGIQHEYDNETHDNELYILAYIVSLYLSGGEVVYLPRTEGVSTTDIKKIVSAANQDKIYALKHMLENTLNHVNNIKF